MSPPKHTLFTFCIKVRTVWLSFLATRYNFQAHASWLSKKPNYTKILLTVCMRPAAITLNYSVENIWNDVCQKIYEESQFDSLVWGSLTLAPIIHGLGNADTCSAGSFSHCVSLVGNGLLLLSRHLK